MLPRRYRLPVVDFFSVRKFGKRTTTYFAEIITAPAKKTESRFLIQVPKKIVAKATQRNRIRRIVSEAIMQSLLLFRGSDVVIQIIKRVPQYKTQDVLAVFKTLK